MLRPQRRGFLLLGLALILLTAGASSAPPEPGTESATPWPFDCGPSYGFAEAGDGAAYTFDVGDGCLP